MFLNGYMMVGVLLIYTPIVFGLGVWADFKAYKYMLVRDKPTAEVNALMHKCLEIRPLDFFAICITYVSHALYYERAKTPKEKRLLQELEKATDLIEDEFCEKKED